MCTAGADPGIFDWGVQTLVQKGMLNFFVANHFSQRRRRVSQSLNAGRRWRGKYCFARRLRRTDRRRVPKEPLHFLISLEFSLVEKCKARFIKKKNQPVNKSQTSVRSDLGGPDPLTLPLDPPLDSLSDILGGYFQKKFSKIFFRIQNYR